MSVECGDESYTTRSEPQGRLCGSLLLYVVDMLIFCAAHMFCWLIVPANFIRNVNNAIFRI